MAWGRATAFPARPPPPPAAELQQRRKPSGSGGGGVGLLHDCGASSGGGGANSGSNRGRFHRQRRRRGQDSARSGMAMGIGGGGVSSPVGPSSGKGGGGGAALRSPLGALKSGSGGAFPARVRQRHFVGVSQASGLGPRKGLIWSTFCWGAATAPPPGAPPSMGLEASPGLRFLRKPFPPPSTFAPPSVGLAGGAELPRGSLGGLFQERSLLDSRTGSSADLARRPWRLAPCSHTGGGRCSQRWGMGGAISTGGGASQLFGAAGGGFEAASQPEGAGGASQLPGAGGVPSSRRARVVPTTTRPQEAARPEPTGGGGASQLCCGGGGASQLCCGGGGASQLCCGGGGVSQLCGRGRRIPALLRGRWRFPVLLRGRRRFPTLLRRWRIPALLRGRGVPGHGRGRRHRHAPGAGGASQEGAAGGWASQPPAAGGPSSPGRGRHPNPPPGGGRVQPTGAAGVGGASQPAGGGRGFPTRSRGGRRGTPEPRWGSPRHRIAAAEALPTLGLLPPWKWPARRAQRGSARAVAGPRPREPGRGRRIGRRGLAFRGLQRRVASGKLLARLGIGGVHGEHALPQVDGTRRLALRLILTGRGQVLLDGVVEIALRLIQLAQLLFGDHLLGIDGENLVESENGVAELPLLLTHPAERGERFRWLRLWRRMERNSASASFSLPRLT